jgi:type I restriction enzyme M protein
VNKTFETKIDITIKSIEKPLSKYISYVWGNITFEDYLSLIENNLNENILNHQIYKNYIDKYTFNKILEIEKEKFFYFILVYKQKLLITKTNKGLAQTKEEKKKENNEEKYFLGYEFSSRRRREGIHPIKRANSIDECTSLYDNNSYENLLKVNSYVYSAFNGEEKSIDESLKENIFYIDLIDMIDFKKINFDKFISINVKNKIEINSKWDIVNLGDYIKFSKKSKRPASNGLNKGKYPFFTSSQIQDKWVDFCDYSIESIIIGDGGSSSIFISSNFSASDHNFIFNSKYNEISNKYIFFYYKTNFRLILNGLQGIALKNISKNYIENLEIPLAPKDIQDKVINEMEALEVFEKNSQDKIENLKNEIKNQINQSLGEEKTLSKICDMKAGKFISASDIEDTKTLENYSCYGGNGLRGYTKTFTYEGTFSLIGRQGALCGNIHRVTGQFHATEHALVVTPLENIDTNWLYYKLKEMNLNQYATGVAQPGLSVKNLNDISVLVPSSDEQKNIVKQIKLIEIEIENIEKELKTIPTKKEQILKKYL